MLSAREQDLLKGKISAQLRGCWRLPGGGGGIETVVVTVHWRLRPDGSLDGEPQVERPQATPVFQIAAEAAVRAVKACAPFTLAAGQVLGVAGDHLGFRPAGDAVRPASHLPCKPSISLPEGHRGSRQDASRTH